MSEPDEWQIRQGARARRKIKSLLAQVSTGWKVYTRMAGTFRLGWLHCARGSQSACTRNDPEWIELRPRRLRLWRSQALLRTKLPRRNTGTRMCAWWPLLKFKRNRTTVYTEIFVAWPASVFLGVSVNVVPGLSSITMEVRCIFLYPLYFDASLDASLSRSMISDCLNKRSTICFILILSCQGKV